MKKRRGCCALLHLREDNARFILLFILMIFYTLCGAGLFMLLERDNEIAEKDKYYRRYRKFLEDNPKVNQTDLDKLLRLHAEADRTGVLKDKRPRWDFAGAFYFVGTVVSTIGFGMTTPRTTPGKVLLIFYGIIGCSGAILFFNLFLERIITFLAYILRAIHDMELKRKGLWSERRRGSQVSDDDSLDSWKPSVYWVQLILLLSACTVACCASAMYYPVEEWSYFESIYFCFVAFATIGFGDYVVSQKANYKRVHLYRFGNFVFLVIGCCCVYSLVNVTSIVIKQVLNWIIKRLDCADCTCWLKRQNKARGRRNAITPGAAKNRHRDLEVDSNYDSELGSRRGSNEMISMKDFLQANKISLAMMQKQLAETANRHHHRESNGLQGGVGPLAILNKKLGQEDA